ncbi:MAG: BrnT family toxin [Paracoccus sp. (in: a-proteobacteria)]
MSNDEMQFEWDEVKRLKTVEKHGIDFLDLGAFFAAEHLVTEARREDEARFLAIGELNGLVIAVVFTERSGRKRIITARRARRNERENFRALFAGGTPQDEGQD